MLRLRSALQPPNPSLVMTILEAERAEIIADVQRVYYRIGASIGRVGTSYLLPKIIYRISPKNILIR